MTSPELSEQTDPFNLARFILAQEETFDVALSELGRGRKQSHWMWYIFPQVDGLGSSPAAIEYAIKSLEEARAYLNHPVIGPRLLKCCRTILSVQGKSASEIMGYPDDLKLRSSMTLFSLVADSHSEFTEVIEKYFRGQQDRLTLELLNIQS